MKIIAAKASPTKSSRHMIRWSGLLMIPFLLAGCSATVSLTVPASDVADAAASKLEEQVGSRPDIDCGSDPVKLINDTKVDCLLVDPKTKSEFDTTVVIGDVDGSKYSIDVQVASEPNGGAKAPTPAATTSDSTPQATPAPDSGAPVIYGYELATTVKDELAKQYGAPPTVTCADDKVSLTVGASYECEVTTAAGARGTGTIKITSVEGSSYSIGISVVDK